MIYLQFGSKDSSEQELISASAEICLQRIMESKTQHLLVALPIISLF